MVYNTIIIGAGPAGLMTAIELQKNNMSYLLLEKNNMVGKKLLITGKSRCNVTNNKSVHDFVDDLTIKNKRFMFSTLYQFGPDQVIDFFRKQDIELVLENNLKYFPKSNKSITILNGLLSKIDKRYIKLNQDVKEVLHNNEEYLIKTSKDTYRSLNVVVATGSKSYPATGSTGEGIPIAKSFDIKYSNFTPAETSVYSKQIVNEYAELQGISLINTPIRIKDTSITFTGDIVFTHFGLSGPSIYHLSEDLYFTIKDGNNTLLINLVSKSENDLNEYLSTCRDNQVFLRKALEDLLPKRLVKVLMEKHSIRNEKVSSMSNKQINKIIRLLTQFEVVIDRVESVEKAYVNKGGIDTIELNPKTLESKKHKGLYFVGETIDVHGPIGGYNITIAFSTGYSAAQGIIKKYK